MENVGIIFQVGSESFMYHRNHCQPLENVTKCFHGIWRSLCFRLCHLIGSWCRRRSDLEREGHTLRLRSRRAEPPCLRTPALLPLTFHVDFPIKSINFLHATGLRSLSVCYFYVFSICSSLNRSDQVTWNSSSFFPEILENN